MDRCNTHGDIGFWMRPVYWEGMRAGTITTLVREGDRSNSNDTRTAPAGVDLAVRFIRKTGDSSRGIKAELYPDDGMTVRRIGMVVKKIKDLTQEDLRGTAPDQSTPDLVRYHLAMIGNTELPSPEDVVTVWKIEYRPFVTD